MRFPTGPMWRFEGRQLVAGGLLGVDERLPGQEADRQKRYRGYMSHITLLAERWSGGPIKVRVLKV